MNQILDDKCFKLFSDFIYQKSGIKFNEANRIVLDSRLREIMRSRQNTSLEDYYKLINSDYEEYVNLLDMVTTNLTSFFRNDGHFWALENEVIPDLIKYKQKTGDNILKIWSAGCSTGEEPYSLAMMLDSILPSNMTFKIMASDISLKSLETARTGFYNEAKILRVPEEFKEKYFDKTDKGYKVKDTLAKKIIFDYHNIINEVATKDFDVVFCRNVLIYFDAESFSKVVKLIYNSMKKYGYFFIGHSESLFKVDTKFKFIKGEQACYYKKEE